MSIVLNKFLDALNGDVMYPPVQNCSPFIHGSGIHLRKYFEPYYPGLPTSPYLNVSSENQSFIVVTERFITEPVRAFFQRYLKNPSLLNERKEAFYKAEKLMDALYKEYTYQSIEGISWEKAVPLIMQIRDQIWDQNAAVWFSFYFDKELCWEELQKAHNSLTRKELDELWEKGTHSNFISFDKAQLLDFLHGVIAKENSARLVERCQYISASYFDVKSLKEVHDMLQDRYSKITTIALAEEKIKEEQKNLVIAQQDLQSWYRNLPSHQQLLVDYLQTIIELRDRRKNYFFRGFTIMWRITEELFKSVDIAPEYIKYYTIAELEKGKAYLSEHAKELMQRKASFAMFIDEDGNTEKEYIDFKKIKEQINDIYLQEQTKITSNQVNEIRGQIGCVGKIQGKVRIVMNAALAENFVEGEILVAGMTRPEYVPLMKKAIAIITDEGGITCHAAIVSRELKIPCIIGTKIATKVLKDGDLVEVDANNGVVKIINT